MAAIAAATAAAIQERRLANLRPHRYPKGVSGITVKSKRYHELHAGIVAGLGEVSGIDAIAVDQIVHLLLRAERAKDHAEAARCSRTAQHWLKDLQARRGCKEQPPLRERLAAEFAGAPDG